MKRKKIGIFTFALTLIGLGIIILLNNFYSFDLNTVFKIFFSIVIILLGIEFIIIKLITEKNPQIEATLDVKSIIFLIIIFIITFSTLAINNINFDNTISLNLFDHIYQYNYDFDKKLEDINNKNSLSIYNPYGSVNISESTDDNINITAEIIINKTNNNEIYTEELSKKLIAIDGTTDDIVKIKSNVKKYINNNKIKNIVINFNIEVPSRFAINVNNKYGDVNIQNLQHTVDINNGYGDVEVKNINGKTKINCPYGNVDAESIGSDLNINSSYNNVITKTIKGNVIIENTYGKVNVDDIDGDLNIKGQYCKFDIDNVNGNVTASTSYKDINIQNVTKDVTIKNKYGNIELYNANHHIDIFSRHSDIILRNSNVIEDSVTIKNEYGDIDLEIPSDQEGQFKLITRYGDIHSNINMNISDENSEKNATAKIGTSTILFDIKNKNGDITIN